MKCKNCAQSASKLVQGGSKLERRWDEYLYYMSGYLHEVLSQVPRHLLSIPPKIKHLFYSHLESLHFFHTVPNFKPSIMSWSTAV
jgi:hypothetical protein